jgi:mRNA-degrading endonuclease RelE of RelBE toxin-antitoxin system
MKRYALFIEGDVHKARRHLRGNVRQRIKQTIECLAQSPRPAESRSLDVTGLAIPPYVELRRLRIERWRIIYAVNDEERWVWLLAIHKRPPYNYEDLERLVVRLG